MTREEEFEKEVAAKWGLTKPLMRDEFGKFSDPDTLSAYLKWLEERK